MTESQALQIQRDQAREVIKVLTNIPNWSDYLTDEQVTLVNEIIASMTGEQTKKG